MSVAFAVAVYFIVWWITLFAILPLRLGTDTVQQDRYAEQSGAPALPQLALKFLITTIVSSLIFALIYVVMAYGLISLDDIPFLRV
jgi:predicted secreted protein